MRTHFKRYQKDSPVSYAEGVFATLELLAARPGFVDLVLLSARGEANEGAGKIRALCAKHQIAVVVDDRAIERLSPRQSHLAIGVFRKYAEPLDPAADHVVLVEPADMGNVGTIVRTMVGFGFRNLALVRPAADVFDPKTVRASMGALFRMAHAYFGSFEEYAREFPRPVLAWMTDGRTPVDQVQFSRPCSLVFGNEARGLAADFQERASSVVIPQTKLVDSLSLPAAVAIALYEVSTRRSSDR